MTINRNFYRPTALIKVTSTKNKMLAFGCFAPRLLAQYLSGSEVLALESPLNFTLDTTYVVCEGGKCGILVPLLFWTYFIR